METFADVNQGCEIPLCVHGGKMFVLHRTQALFFPSHHWYSYMGEFFAQGMQQSRAVADLFYASIKLPQRLPRSFSYVTGWGVTQTPMYAAWSKLANSLATHRGAPDICQKNYGWWEKLTTSEINSLPKESLLRREKDPPHAKWKYVFSSSP